MEQIPDQTFSAPSPSRLRSHQARQVRKFILGLGDHRYFASFDPTAMRSIPIPCAIKTGGVGSWKAPSAAEVDRVIRRKIAGIL